MKRYDQQSDETRAYEVDVVGGTIASAAWTITPSGTLGTPVNTDSASTVLLSGLAVRTTPYTLKAKLTLDDGQIADSEAFIFCRK